MTVLGSERLKVGEDPPLYWHYHQNLGRHRSLNYLSSSGCSFRCPLFAELKRTYPPRLAHQGPSRYLAPLLRSGQANLYCQAHFGQFTALYGPDSSLCLDFVGSYSGYAAQDR